MNEIRFIKIVVSVEDYNNLKEGAQVNSGILHYGIPVEVWRFYAKGQWHAEDSDGNVYMYGNKELKLPSLKDFKPLTPKHNRVSPDWYLERLDERAEPIIDAGLE